MHCQTALEHNVENIDAQRFFSRAVRAGGPGGGGGGHDPTDFGRSGDGGRLYPPDYYLPPHPGFSDFPTSLFSFDMVQVVGPSLRKNSRTANSIFPEVDEKL
jgi:hypothetical protein